MILKTLNKIIEDYLNTLKIYFNIINDKMLSEDVILYTSNNNFLNMVNRSREYFKSDIFKGIFDFENYFNMLVVKAIIKN